MKECCAGSIDRDTYLVSLAEIRSYLSTHAISSYLTLNARVFSKRPHASESVTSKRRLKDGL